MRRRGGRGWELAGATLVTLGLLAPVGLVSCGDGVRAEEAKSRAGAASVTGTTLDANSGEALVGVLIEGPRETRAVSDLAGRFELLGLREGDRGALIASRGARYRGELPLQPLRPGRLEVVFHLESAEE